jgi:hypothetical protein
MVIEMQRKISRDKMNKYCCFRFEDGIKDKTIIKDEETKTFDITDGGYITVFENIKYCPFCGKKLSEIK